MNLIALKSWVVIAILGLVFALPVFATAPEPPVIEEQVTVITEEPKPEPKKKLDPVKDNPNDCNLNTQYVWEDFSCHDKPIKATPRSVTVATPSNDWVAQCKAWALQAGITLPPVAINLIDKESKCNPNAQNPNSTAYGIFQFLDSTWTGVGCVKTSDPVEQMRCGWKYVQNRYNGWGGAWSFWLNNSWY